MEREQPKHYYASTEEGLHPIFSCKVTTHVCACGQPFTRIADLNDHCHRLNQKG